MQLLKKEQKSPDAVYWKGKTESVDSQKSAIQN